LVQTNDDRIETAREKAVVSKLTVADKRKQKWNKVAKPRTFEVDD